MKTKYLLVTLTSVAVICACTQTDNKPGTAVDPQQKLAQMKAAFKSVEKSKDTKKVLAAQEDLLNAYNMALKDSAMKNPELNKQLRAEMFDAAQTYMQVAKRAYGLDNEEMLKPLAWLEIAALKQGDHEALASSFDGQLNVLEKKKMTDTTGYMLVLGRWAYYRPVACGAHLDLNRLDHLVRLKEKYHGKEAPETIEAKLTLSSNLGDAGKTKEACAVLQEITPLAKTKTPQNYPLCLARLAKLYCKDGKKKEAEKLFAEELSLVAPGKELANFNLFNTCVADYGFLLYDEKKYVEAANVYKAGLDEIERSKFFQHNDFKFWLDRYVECLTKSNKTKLAQDYKKRLLAQAKAAGIDVAG